MAQLQVNATAATLSVITGAVNWVEIAISADPLDQHFLLTAERRFWLSRTNGWLATG